VIERTGLGRHGRAPAAFLVCGLLALTGCGGEHREDSGSTSSGGTPATTEDGTLRIVTAEPPQTLDPVQSPNSTVDQMALNLYDTLVQFEPGDDKPTARMASEFEVSNDGLTYDFTLNDGMTFHDGSPVTAEDVVFTLDRVKDLEAGIWSEIAAYDSSEAISDTEVQITLSRRSVPFLGALSRVYILNSKLVEKNLGKDNGQSWLANNDAGSGPFSLVDYSPNQSAKFSAFEDYHRGAPKLSEVDYSFIAEPTTQKALLESGEADIAMNIAKRDLPAFDGNADYRVDAADTPVQLYIFFNTASGPTKDKRVREALSYAYDYTTHVERILDGYGERAHGPLPRPFPCWSEGTPQPDFDLDRARQLLDQAGVGDLTLEMEFLPALEEEKEAFQLYQSTLKQIGVTLKPLATTFPAYMEMLQKADTTPDLGAVYTFPLFPDPHEVLYIGFHSDFRLGAGFNFAQYGNPQVDELLEKGAATPDEAERCAAYEQVQKVIAEDYVGVNVSLPQYVTVVRSNVQGYAYNGAHHQTENTYDISLSG